MCVRVAIFQLNAPIYTYSANVNYNLKTVHIYSFLFIDAASLHQNVFGLVQCAVGIDSIWPHFYLSILI